MWAGTVHFRKFHSTQKMQNCLFDPDTGFINTLRCKGLICCCFLPLRCGAVLWIQDRERYEPPNRVEEAREEWGDICVLQQQISWWVTDFTASALFTCPDLKKFIFCYFSTSHPLTLISICLILFVVSSHWLPSPGSYAGRAKIDGATLTIHSVTQKDSGQYRCEVTASEDHTNLGEAIVTLNVLGGCLWGRYSSV